LAGRAGRNAAAGATAALLLCVVLLCVLPASLPAAGPAASDPFDIELVDPWIAPRPADFAAELGADAPAPAPNESLQGTSLEQRVKQLEQQQERAKEAEAKKKADDAKRPTAKFTMQLQADSLMFHQDDANRATVGDIQDGEAFRRARVGWFGDYSIVEYRIEFDFALPGRPTLLDVWVAWKDLPILGRVKVGHFFEPFGLDRYTPNRYMWFLERSLTDQAFMPARNLGIIAYNTAFEQHATWAVGVFRTNSNDFGDDSGDNGERSLTGRFSWLPWYDEPSGGRYYLHLGAAYSFRDADNDLVHFRAQPEARFGAHTPNVPYFVDTGDLPAHWFQLAGVEAVATCGPFCVQAEYVLTPVNLKGNQPDALLHSGYVQASFFLTGEHHPYRRDIGVLDRVMPFEDFFRVRTPAGIGQGKGAWEVAGRLSHLDLQDGNVHGGRLTDVTLGVNWYMNAWTRISFNYIHAFLDPSGQENNGADIFGLRAGFEY
jgi:phosphate-selective porin OprO/OprP